jgi:3-dehydroquinate synthase
VSDLRRIDVTHELGSTPVLVGEEALEAAQLELGPWWRDRTVFLVVSHEVDRLHGDSVRQPIAAEAARVVTLKVPDGEGAKTMVEADRLWQAMAFAGGKRDSRLITLGGGSVGDLGGFVAGTFLRGIEFVQIPTTLLAQVDASVGGKTGIDLPSMKNAVGLFVHPEAVVADSRLLSTLPEPELRAGLFEVVKMAVLLDPPLLERVEEELAHLLAGDPVRLSEIVARSVAAKARIVERDPRERDERRLLNLGHTLAHAIEAQQGYSGLRHGEAVGYGMLFAFRLACAGGLDRELASRIHRLIARIGLPPLRAVAVDGLWEAMTRDKKARQGGLVWVLPVGLGEGRMVSGIDPSAVRSHLQDFLEDPLARPENWAVEPELRI